MDNFKTKEDHAKCKKCRYNNHIELKKKYCEAQKCEDDYKNERLKWELKNCKNVECGSVTKRQSNLSKTDPRYCHNGYKNATINMQSLIRGYLETGKRLERFIIKVL
jgi:hypothetical protein